MRVCLKLDRLKKELSKSNKSQKHGAITLGLSRGHLSEILNGRHPFPSPKTREKLVLCLRVTFEDLFEGAYEEALRWIPERILLDVFKEHNRLHLKVRTN